MGANIVVISSSVLPQVQSVNGQTGVISLQLSGDATSPAGSFATTLATVNGNVGSFGDASHTVTITLDGKGRATAAAANAIAIDASQIVSGTFAAGRMPAYTGDIAVTAGTTSTTLATVNANVGTFGSATQIPTFTVNAKGLITGASANAISLAVAVPIGSTTASTGAFTTLSASSTVSGTGFSTYLASPPAIGGTAPAAGSFTTLSATGNFTPSQTNGIVGTTTNNNANAGSVGEYVTASFSAVSLTNGTQTNLTSISLTAGDWDVDGGVNIVGGASNILSNVAMGVSTTSATLGAVGTYAQWQGGGTVLATVFGAAMPTQRLSLASTTTVYAVGLASFASSTVTSTGYIRARRRR